MTDPKQIRQYLLGQIKDEPWLEQFELSLLGDNELLELLLVEEDEIIDDFVCCALSSEDLVAFESNFVLTPERKRKIEFSKAARNKFGLTSSEDIPEQAPGILDRLRAILGINRLQPAVALSMLFLGCCVAAWYIFLRPSDESPILASLNRAFQAERPVNARISGLDYAPYSERRGVTGPVSDENALRRAENMSRDAVFAHETAETLHDLGKLQIAKRDYAEAKKTLERALAKKADDPSILNELGVAELLAAESSAKDSDRLRFAATALEHFDKATRISPKFAEAWFNRAVATGKLKQNGQEAAAWRDYLKVDSTSKWANEARARLALLEQNAPRERSAAELIDDFLNAYRRRDRDTAFDVISRNREMIRGKLVTQQLAFLFADADPRSVQAVEYIDALKFIGDVEFDKIGDPFARDIAAFYAASGTTEHVRIKTAQDAMRDGYRLTLAGSYTEAIVPFQSAKKTFDSLGNKMESGIASYWIAYLLQQGDDIAGSRALLTSASSQAEKAGYIWLNSHFLTWLSLLEFFEDNLSGRISLARQALTLSEKCRDDYNIARLYESLATAYLMAGSFDRSLEYAAKGIAKDATGDISLRQRWRTLNNVSHILSMMKFYGAAKVFESEALALTRNAIGENAFEYMSLLRLGQIESKRSNFDPAIAHFAESRRVAGLLDVAGRERHLAYLNLAEGHALRDADRCAEAIDIYQSAARYYDTRDAKLDRYDLHRGLLICQMALGNDAPVQSETQIVLGLLDKYREKIREESNRNSFFGGEQEIFDELIDYEFRRGNTAKALEYSELSRSRSLLDMLSLSATANVDSDSPDVQLPAGFSRPIPLEEIRTGLSNNIQLLVYSVLHDRTVAWVMSDGKFDSVSIDVSKKKLDDAVLEYVSTISTPGSFSRTDGKSGKHLASLLIQPVRRFIDPTKTVVVIPDKSLAKLPFGALPSAKGFLAEEYAFQYAPSYSVFLLATKALDNRRATGEEKLLAVGDPAFDRSEFPDYTPLTGAKREADAIGKLYTASTVFSGRDATHSAIESDLRETDVFHFAGHYVYDPDSPLRSGLLVTGAGEKTMMRNFDLVGKKFDRLRVAVLSACTTGSEKIIEGEGMLGAARIFLAGGVPQVVASHWEVDSEATAELMINFHKNRKSNGLSTVRALREAQLSMINGPDPRQRDPYYWAPFFSIGGLSD
jgi:CHAT domain-containing protein